MCRWICGHAESSWVTWSWPASTSTARSLFGIQNWYEYGIIWNYMEFLQKIKQDPYKTTKKNTVRYLYQQCCLWSNWLKTHPTLDMKLMYADLVIFKHFWCFFWYINSRIYSCTISCHLRWLFFQCFCFSSKVISHFHTPVLHLQMPQQKCVESHLRQFEHFHQLTSCEFDCTPRIDFCCKNTPVVESENILQVLCWCGMPKLWLSLGA